jgi:flagellar biosynthesis GTPase FlhF
MSDFSVDSSQDLLLTFNHIDKHSPSTQVPLEQTFYYYQAYNLRIKSPFVIPEFLAITPQETDITIIEQKVPIRLSNILTEGLIEDDCLEYQLNDTELLLIINKTRRILIKDKKTIIVENDSLKEDIFSYAFVALMMLQNNFSLHASAILTYKGVVLFTGVSGVGKSTTAAKLRERGYTFLSEDTSLVTFDTEGVAYVHPAYPQIRLWEKYTRLYQ